MMDFGGIEVSPYTALVGLGILAGLGTTWLCLRRWVRRAARSEVFLDGALLTLAASWLGARAYHLLTHWEYYAARPEEIASWGVGGLGMRGALVAGMIALTWFAGARRLPWGKLLDAAAIGLALGQAIGWLGAIIQGVNYGAPTESRWALELANIYGLVEPRYPVQHAEVVLFGLVFLGLLILSGKGLAAGQFSLREGSLFFTYMLLTSLGNGLVGFLRGDETAQLGLFRVDQVVDAALAAVGALGLLFLASRTRSSESACGADTG